LSAFGNCGYLMKRGQNIKNWCRRWFVCRDEYLLYFKSPKVCTMREHILSLSLSLSLVLALVLALVLVLFW
jgi:hypothetical protein